jgi:hypothetical protein
LLANIKNAPMLEKLVLKKVKSWSVGHGTHTYKCRLKILEISVAHLIEQNVDLKSILPAKYVNSLRLYISNQKTVDLVIEWLVYLRQKYTQLTDFKISAYELDAMAESPLVYGQHIIDAFK